MVAFLRSRERGEGPITAGPITALARFQINGRVSRTITTQTFDQQIRVVGFPPRAEIQITFCQLWVIPSPSSTIADRLVYLGLLAASEDEAVILAEQFFQRFIDMIVIKQQAEGTLASWEETLIDGRQVWVDELYNTLGGVALESVPDGLYLYAQNSATTDVSVNMVARIHAEILFHQMNYADDYTQNGKRFTEGWSGYEWEESLGDAMELGTVDEAL